MDTTNGGRTGKYSWGQSTTEVHVYVAVPKFTKAKDVLVRITPNALLVALKGEQAESAALVDGGLFRKVSVDESTWTMEGKEQELVHVYLEKSDSDFMWSAVIDGDVDCDAGKNFLVAAREGRASDLVRLMRAGVDANSADPETGFTALHWAVACGQLEAVAVLLDLATSLDINARDLDNNTPLLVAVQNLRTKAALAVLEKGADVHLPNKAGGTALMLAAGTGEITLVRALLRAGADVNAQDHGGLTAAMHASKLCQSAVIVMLVQEGNADLSLTCKEGKTAEAYAGDQPTKDTLAADSIFLQAHGRSFI